MQSYQSSIFGQFVEVIRPQPSSQSAYKANPMPALQGSIAGSSQNYSNSSLKLKQKEIENEKQGKVDEGNKKSVDSLTCYTDNVSVTRSGCELKGLRKHRAIENGSTVSISNKANVSVKPLTKTDTFYCICNQQQQRSQKCMVCAGEGCTDGNNNLVKFIQYIMEFKLKIKSAYQNQRSQENTNRRQANQNQNQNQNKSKNKNKSKSKSNNREISKNKDKSSIKNIVCANLDYSQEFIQQRTVSNIGKSDKINNNLEFNDDRQRQQQKKIDVSVKQNKQQQEQKQKQKQKIKLSNAQKPKKGISLSSKLVASSNLPSISSSSSSRINQFCQQFINSQTISPISNLDMNSNSNLNQNNSSTNDGLSLNICKGIAKSINLIRCATNNDSINNNMINSNTNTNTNTNNNSNTNNNNDSSDDKIIAKDMIQTTCNSNYLQNKSRISIQNQDINNVSSINVGINGMSESIVDQKYVVPRFGHGSDQDQNQNQHSELCQRQNSNYCSSEVYKYSISKSQPPNNQHDNNNHNNLNDSKNQIQFASIINECYGYPPPYRTQNNAGISISKQKQQNQYKQQSISFKNQKPQTQKQPAITQSTFDLSTKSMIFGSASLPPPRMSLPSSYTAASSMNLTQFRQKLSLQNTVHNGYQCNNCQICPIVGTRYHCGTLMCHNDYDLCENCYKTIGHKHKMEEIKYCKSVEKICQNLQNFNNKNNNFIKSTARLSIGGTNLKSSSNYQYGKEDTNNRNININRTRKQSGQDKNQDYKMIFKSSIH